MGIQSFNLFDPNAYFFDERDRKSTVRKFFRCENILSSKIDYQSVKKLLKESVHTVEIPGLSASQQLSASQLEKFIKKVPSRNFTVIDLREETHFYVDGFPVSITNRKNNLNEGKPLSQIEQEENAIAEALKNKEIPLYKRVIKEERDAEGVQKKRVSYVPKESLLPKNVETEAALVKRLNGTYIRMPITDHGGFLSTNEIDSLVSLYDAQKKKAAWVHVHCAAGKGRSSSALTMLAILTWAKSLSLEEIFSRLEARGNKQLIQQPEPGKQLKQRSNIEFWKIFHAFAKNRSSGMLWSDWEKKEGLGF